METFVPSPPTLFDSEELDALQSSVEARPVSRPQSRAHEKAQQMSDGYGESFCDWCQTFGPCFCWQRILSASLVSTVARLSPGSCPVWSRRATRCRRLLLVLQTSVRRIEEDGSGLSADWPTPDASASERRAKSATTYAQGKSGQQGHGHAVTINDVAQHWPTPTLRDWGDGRASPETMQRNARPLNEIAVTTWPTPNASPHSIYAETDETYEARQKNGGAVSLARSAVSHPAPPATGPASRPNSGPPLRELNWRFVCALMSFPQNWFEGVETQSSKG
jgi:hypothetical protein